MLAGRRRFGAIVPLGGPTMGTRWSAQVVDPTADCAGIITGVLHSVIAQMSQWEPASVISRFNRTGPGAWMTLPPEMLTVVRAALTLARMTGGAFDPAIGRLVDRWGFGPGDPGEAAPRVAAPWTHIELAGEQARRTADVTLDLSGIAKGYAVDAVADALRAAGMANFLIEIGGELRGEGVKPDMQPWWVDTETPPGLVLPPLRVALSGLSIATSGDYRRFHAMGDGRLSHSIDPATGAPVRAGIASVSVLHREAMLADAWATAIIVMGVERGMALASREGIAALLVQRTAAGPREYMTPALAAMLA